MGLPPIVTGVSPKEGPPGTRVTIRGERLGYGPEDIIGLNICGSDCLLSAEWKSSNKIVARSGPGKGRGDIIVTTKSGGSGTCTVQFRGFHETIGPLKESAVWVDESHLLGLGRHRPLLPASFQQEDPLGLSVENTEKKFPEEDLHDLFPEGSGDLGIENFVPAWFLLENHHTTSFDDLKAGMNFLKRKVNAQKEGQISFLKAHVGSIIEQMDTLTSLKEKIQETKKKVGPDLTSSLEKSIQLAKIEADRLFEDVLERKDRADATRNALSTMQRFRFLFHLPASLDNNIQKGDYDLVINDYARAKTLFGNTDVKIFKKVLQEADLRIVKLRQLLSEKLTKYPATLEEQKKIIRNLVNLEAPDNPAWNCITGQYKYTSKLLFDCKDVYITKEEEIAKVPKQKDAQKTSESQGTTIPSRITFLEELTELFYGSFPELWRIGQAYFSGELHVRVDPTKQAEFKRMVADIVTIYSQLVRAAFIPQTLDRHSPHRAQFGMWQPFNSTYASSEGVGSWLVACLRCVRTCYTGLLTLSLPAESLNIVKDLLHDLRVHCMRSILLQATENVHALAAKENFSIEYIEKHGSITQLPTIFEAHVLECLQLVKETVFQAEKSEPDLLDNASVLGDLNILVQKLLVAFAKTLDRVASSDNEDEDLGRETRVLLQLSNCQYTVNHIIPRFEDHWKKLGYPDLSSAVGVAFQQLRATDEKLLEAYLEEKVEPLIGIVEPSMYSRKFDWNTRVEPCGVRPYSKEIIMNMIAVHAEVGQICPSLINQILGRVVKEIGAELGRLFSCVQKFSRQGILQARADVAALSRAALSFAVDEPFAEAQAIIPPLQSQEDRVVLEKILSTFERQMRFQLCCLDPTIQYS